MKFLGEMKRRNVFRIGMAYIVTAWVLIQLGDITAKSIDAPPWIMALVIIFLVFGFPLALYFSWAYEITPDGIRREADVDREASITKQTGRKLDYYTVALLVTIAGVMTLDRFMPKPPGTPVAVESPRPAEPQSEPEADAEPVVIEENSIAVLPFENMSTDLSQNYFSDGLSEELLNVLTQVQGLNVASRTSSFAFRGTTKSIQQIGRALRVANILEGSVRKSGDRLRITAQLIDTSNDRHIWSDSYDRDLNDIFQIQDEIANAIVSALTAELGVGLEAVSVESATSNLDAYDLYLQARELFIARKNLPTSWQLLEKATSLDPEFARAWEALAAAHFVGGSWHPGDGINHDARARAAAIRALELDPDLSMPYAVLGMENPLTGKGFAAALANLDMALKNDPKNSTAWLWRGLLYKDMGYMDLAISDLEQCLAVDAGYLNCTQHMADALFMRGRVVEAVKLYESTLEANFHSTDDTFVSYYVQTDQHNMAYLVAALSVRQQFAPIKDWIEAIKNPEADHTDRVANFNKWAAPLNMTVCDFPMVGVALRQEQCFTAIDSRRLIWHPDAAYFRKSQTFKDYINTHLMAFWQENGFPPQCRALEDGDFKCD
jgi:TolB-like protein/Flp pilus assembly protein TadD